MLLTLNWPVWLNQDKHFHFLRTLQIKIPTLWGRRLWVGRLRHPKHPTSTKQTRTQVLELGPRDLEPLHHDPHCNGCASPPDAHHPRMRITPDASSLIHPTSSYLISLSHILFKNMAHAGSFSYFVFVCVFVFVFVFVFVITV